MARVSNEQRLDFEQAMFAFLSEHPKATTETVGKALYDDWRSPGPEGKRPKEDRATDWAKRKLKALAKNGKVYQPSRGLWEMIPSAASTPTPKTTKLRKKAVSKKENGKENGDGTDTNFAPVNVFNMDEPASFYEVVGNNSPFIKGLLSTAERHGSIELPEPMLHALIEEMAMAFGRFDN